MDPARMHKIFGLRPYVQIGVWLVAAALAITVALGVLAAAHAFDWLPERTTGNGFIEDLRQRVAGALTEYRQGKIDDGQYLCALIGISGVREGLNLQVLTAEARGDWRFLGVAGAGLGIESVETYANLVSDTALRPDVAVVGFTPS
jgi:hypothetical protein